MFLLFLPYPQGGIHKEKDLAKESVKKERRAEEMERFTAVFEQEGDWWIGYVEELPGANTQGRTLEEARGNLREAVQLVLEANRELARREAEGHSVIREELVLHPR